MAQNQTPAAWRGNGGSVVQVTRRSLSTKPKRARQEVLTAPPSRLERQHQHANQAALRRAKFARALAAAAFDDHRGTRLSVSMLQHPTVPPTRRAP